MWDKESSGGGSTVTASSINGNIKINGTETTIYNETALNARIDGLTLAAQASRFSGKVWNAIGDSITEVNFRTTKNYHNYIKDSITCTVNNRGISGTGWFSPSGAGATDAIHQRISAMPSADLITVFAGTNDWGQVGKTLVLGTMGDTDPLVSFYGAVYSCLSQLINKYPSGTIAVFTPLPRGATLGEVANSSGITLRQVADAIIQVSNYFSIPVLDLYRNSGFAPWNNTQNETYFAWQPGSGDRLHPNAEGHRLLANKILAFLNTL